MFSRFFIFIRNSLKKLIDIPLLFFAGLNCIVINNFEVYVCLTFLQDNCYLLYLINYYIWLVFIFSSFFFFFIRFKVKFTIRNIFFFLLTAHAMYLLSLRFLVKLFFWFLCLLKEDMLWVFFWLFFFLDMVRYFLSFRKDDVNIHYEQSKWFLDKVIASITYLTVALFFNFLWNCTLFSLDWDNFFYSVVFFYRYDLHWILAYIVIFFLILVFTLFFFYFFYKTDGLYGVEYIMQTVYYEYWFVVEILWAFLLFSFLMISIFFELTNGLTLLTTDLGVIFEKNYPGEFKNALDTELFTDRRNQRSNLITLAHILSFINLYRKWSYILILGWFYFAFYFFAFLVTRWEFFTYDDYCSELRWYLKLFIALLVSSIFYFLIFFFMCIGGWGLYLINWF